MIASGLGMTYRLSAMTTLFEIAIYGHYLPDHPSKTLPNKISLYLHVRHQLHWQSLWSKKSDINKSLVFALKSCKTKEALF